MSATIFTVFEAGKSYRASNNETYTVTKCTTSFVTVINASGTLTIRRKPNCHADGYEWISLGAGRTLEARKVIEAPVSQPEEVQETQKGRKTMTKITTEQAVTAVKSATTAEEVQAVLEQCKKNQLHEVFLAVTGAGSELSPNSWTKAKLVCSYTAGIMKFREREEFENKPFEEKYEALMNCSRHFQRIAYICLFSSEEVRMTAKRLGLSFDHSHCSLADAVLKELRIRDKMQLVTECAKAKDMQMLKDTLMDSDFGGITHEAFSRLIVQAGLNMDEATNKDTLKIGELLYRYYTESKEPVAEVKADETVSAYNMGFDETAYSPDIQEVSVIVDDIPAAHETDVQEVKNTQPATVSVQEDRKTVYERRLEERKELQAEIHELWQKRHALNKAQRVFGEGSADAEALSDMWDMYHDQADVLLGEYWRVCKALAQERECLRRDEADSQLAGTLAITEAVTHSKPEVQPMQTSKPKATLSTKKKPTKVSRKTYIPNWVKPVQLGSKPRRHNPNSKPLMKATKAASMIRVRKF